MSTTQLFRISPLTAALAIALIPTSSWAANVEHTKETKEVHAINSNDVITVTAPAISPLNVASSLKNTPSASACQ